MTTETIVMKKMNSANVRLDNSGDPERAYEISANTDVSNGRATRFDGEVHREGAYLANFNCGDSDDNLSVNFQSVPAAQQCAVLGAVQEFLSACRSYVAGNASLASL